MRNIKLVLEYDGSHFSGFQRQPHHVTVQEVLEDALTKFFDRKTKITAASGRTDAGVHAMHQVVNFKIKSDREPRQIQRGLNAHLPKQVAVRSAEDVPSAFHARFSAKSKTYEYRIWNDPVRSPLETGRVCHIAEPLNVANMRKAAKLLTGRRDFRSFCAVDGKDSSPERKRGTVRTIYHFEIQKKGNLIVLRIEADGFLYHMVRNLAGALIEVGRGRLTPLQLKKIQSAKDRRSAPATAPAPGLTLIGVKY